MTTDSPTRCTCGRILRSPKSIAAGIGPVCARRARTLAALSPAQVEKARQLVEDRGIVDTGIRTDRGRRVFEVIPSSGVGRYFATVTACTCPAGLKGRRCYHSAALRLAS